MRLQLIGQSHWVLFRLGSHALPSSMGSRNPLQEPILVTSFACDLTGFDLCSSDQIHNETACVLGSGAELGTQTCWLTKHCDC